MKNYDTIVFVSLDTLRSDAIGACPWKLWPAKYPRLSATRPPKTPALDHLAKASAYFPQAISSAPYTSASHASYFTGKMPLRHGVYEFFNRPLLSDTIFTEAKKLGWGTLFKADFPIILGKYLGFDRDVDEYIVEDDERFLASLKERRGPTMAFVHFGGIHIPYGFHNLEYGKQDYLEKIVELEKEVDCTEQLPSDQLVETFRSREDFQLLLRYKRVVQQLYDTQRFDRLFELYLEGVEYFMAKRFDPFFARLQDVLKGRRSLLVVFGDHGEEYDQESYGHFNSLAEGVLRVPVMIAGADVVAKVHTERMRTIDIAPTLFEAMGVSAAADGVSLARTVFAGESYPKRPAIAQSYISLASEFVAYQKKMLETGTLPGQLRHVRFKETVYSGSEKLVRQTHTYALENGEWALKRIPARIALETIGDDFHPRTIDDPARTTALLQELDRYNQTQPETEQRTVNMTADIRAELQSMGYRV